MTLAFSSLLSETNTETAFSRLTVGSVMLLTGPAKKKTRAENESDSHTATNKTTVIMEKEEIVNNENEGLYPEPEFHSKELENLENELKETKDQLFSSKVRTRTRSAVNSRQTTAANRGVSIQ